MLKKAILLSSILACINTFAQERQVTFHLNPTLSWLSSNTSAIVTKGNLFGYDAGVDVDEYLSNDKAYYWGVTITSLGGKLDNESLNETYGAELNKDETTTLRYNSINIPVGFKYNFLEVGYSNLYAQAGLVGQYCYSSSVTPDDETSLAEEIKDEVSNTNIGYQIGTGVEYSLTRSTGLVVGVMYNSFLYSILSNHNSVSNSNISLRLGLRF